MRIVLAFMFSLMLSNSAKADQSTDAIRKASEAAIKHFKIDKMAKRLEKKYINEDIKHYGGYAWIVADVVIKQRVTYKWTF